MYHSSLFLGYDGLFTFLHLYFKPYFRAVGIFFPALCACIVHDICIYIPVRPLRYNCHSLCHLRQAMPNFHHESKVTCHHIFIVEIWHFAWLRPHPFKSQISKPPCMQIPESQCQSHVFTANFWKLRFYQNKGLSLDKHCGVPNTFSTRNQTSGPNNQDFLAAHIRLRKMLLFLT